MSKFYYDYENVVEVEAKEVQATTKKSTKNSNALNIIVATMFGGLLAVIITGVATFEKRINIDKEKVIYGESLNPDQSQKLLKRVKGEMETYYQSAENTFTSQKAEMYAMRDVEHLRTNYNSSYESQQKYLEQERLNYFCRYNSQDKACQQLIKVKATGFAVNFKKPKGINNPFSWQADKSPPMPKSIKPNKDNIAGIIAENNIKTVIKAGY